MSADSPTLAAADTVSILGVDVRTGSERQVALSDSAAARMIHTALGGRDTLTAMCCPPPGARR
jgi:hypothetical protein